ncbi:unannotated protein [freshwater metagenome]|uniref:Unannotated protein n=1 Tax=freshwater metagenome TaxID=449393 RepID=A0A6J6UTN9_9ZZZZ
MTDAIAVMSSVPKMAGPMPGPTDRLTTGMSLVRKSMLSTEAPLEITV